MRRSLLTLTLILVLCVSREASAGIAYAAYLPVVQRSRTYAACIPPAGAVESGLVSHVVDGDTIDVVIDGVEQRVRYIGMDTPENTGEQEPFGPEATARNRQLVDGRPVTLLKDQSQTDRYGRLLRFVYVGDTFVNEQLVREGLAEKYPYSPDLSCAGLFAQAEDEARRLGLGLWSLVPTAEPAACNCSGPDLDCADFSTHNQAQSCFDYCVSLGKGDIFRLDSDGDGLACESLP